MTTRKDSQISCFPNPFADFGRYSSFSLVVNLVLVGRAFVISCNEYKWAKVVVPDGIALLRRHGGLWLRAYFSWHVLRPEGVRDLEFVHVCVHVHVSYSGTGRCRDVQVCTTPTHIFQHNSMLLHRRMLMLLLYLQRQIVGEPEGQRYHSRGQVPPYLFGKPRVWN